MLNLFKRKETCLENSLLIRSLQILAMENGLTLPEKSQVCKTILLSNMRFFSEFSFLFVDKNFSKTN